MSESKQALRLRFETEAQYDALRADLVFGGYAHRREQGAFLFASEAGNGELVVGEVALLGPEDFAVQTANCLELREDLLQEMILRAHRTDTALVEAHSHPFAIGHRLRFSASHCTGLSDVGPHVAWRLPGRPYIALVFGWNAFDSLYWEGRDQRPRGTVDLAVSRQVLRPSRGSKRIWRQIHG